MSKADRENEPDGEKRPWETPKLQYVGHLGDVVQGGGGKTSTSAGDPGEPNKPKPPGPEGG